MKRLLIISPHFPPVDAVDMHRIRQGVNHYREYGWEPTVLCVRPADTGRLLVPELLETIPDDLDVRYVPAIPLRLAQRFGVRAVGLRSIFAMYRAGNKLLGHTKYDLVFFSTTAFPLMPLGRLWRRKFGVPYVLDIQDPWTNNYAGRRGGPKHSLMHAIHRRLERWTVPQASGIIAVSDGYIETLSRRYPEVNLRPARCIPFGVLPRDFAVACQSQSPCILATTPRTGLRGVYTGALGSSMSAALCVLLDAWRLGVELHGELFSDMQMFFIGSSYANGQLAEESLMQLARRKGAETVCFEQPIRVPYFQTLEALRSADFLILPVSDADGYVPSKLFPLLYLEKPIVAVAPTASPVARQLVGLPSVALACFPECGSDRRSLEQFVERWRALISGSSAIKFEPQRSRLEQYKAQNVALAECELFDQAVAWNERPDSIVSQC